MSTGYRSTLGTPEIRRLLEKLNVIKVAGSNHARLLQWGYHDPKDNTYPVYTVTGDDDLIKALLPHFQKITGDIHDMQAMDSGGGSLSLLASTAPSLTVSPLAEDNNFSTVVFPKTIAEHQDFARKATEAVLELPIEFDITHRDWKTPSKHQLGG